MRIKITRKPQPEKTMSPAPGRQPPICIRKLKSIGVDNGERFTILIFSEIPDYSVMKKEELEAIKKTRYKVK